MAPQDAEPAAPADLDLVHDAGQPVRSRCCSASGLGDLLAGLPIDKSGEFTGNFFDLLQPYAIWVGLTIVGLSLLHGSIFLALKTTDDIRDRAVAAAEPLGWLAIALVLGFVIWTRILVGTQDLPTPVEALALIAVVFAARLAHVTRPQRLGLHRVSDRDRLSHRLDLHRPLPQRDGLEHQLGLQPHRLRDPPRAPTR